MIQASRHVSNCNQLTSISFFNRFYGFQSPGVTLHASQSYTLYNFTKIVFCIILYDVPLPKWTNLYIFERKRGIAIKRLKWLGHVNISWYLNTELQTHVPSDTAHFLLLSVATPSLHWTFSRVCQLTKDSFIELIPSRHFIASSRVRNRTRR